MTFMNSAKILILISLLLLLSDINTRTFRKRKLLKRDGPYECPLNTLEFELIFTKNKYVSMAKANLIQDGKYEINSLILCLPKDNYEFIQEKFDYDNHRFMDGNFKLTINNMKFIIKYTKKGSLFSSDESKTRIGSLKLDYSFSKDSNITLLNDNDIYDNIANNTTRINIYNLTIINEKDLKKNKENSLSKSWLTEFNVEIIINILYNKVIFNKNYIIPIYKRFNEKKNGLPIYEIPNNISNSPIKLAVPGNDIFANVKNTNNTLYTGIIVLNPP